MLFISREPGNLMCHQHKQKHEYPVQGVCLRHMYADAGFKHISSNDDCASGPLVPFIGLTRARIDRGFAARTGHGRLS